MDLLGVFVLALTGGLLIGLAVGRWRASVGLDKRIARLERFAHLDPTQSVGA